MKMKRFKCTGCFADGDRECRILEKRIECCPFRKTTEKFYVDRYIASNRLNRLAEKGEFNPDNLVNLREQAIAAMELTR